MRSEEETEHNEKKTSPGMIKIMSGNRKVINRRKIINRRIREDFGIVSYCTIIES